MANNSFFAKRMNLLHLPTLMIIVGYITYWLELYVVKLEGGHASWLAWSFFSSIALLLIFINRNNAKDAFKKSYSAFLSFELCDRFLCICGLILSVFILLIGFKASLLPPHLGQEFDALNYHITIPRQHLILHSFEHLSWSAADLFLLPLDYALAPYWLATYLPNKFPQFLFVLSLVFIIAQLSVRLSVNTKTFFYAIFAILGLHIFSIQIGLAMVDLVMVYLFFASIHSWLRRNFTLAGAEIALYFWSKPLMPVTMSLFLILMFGAAVVVCRKGFVITERFLLTFNGRKDVFLSIKKFTMAFLVVSFIFASPFVARSIYHAGTPFFPMAPGVFTLPRTPAAEPEFFAAIKESSQLYMAAKDDYGYNRNLSGFIKHLWVIAVPEKGVNNRFDYPVGLVYLLCLGPFILSGVDRIRTKKISLIHMAVFISWGLWWMGSQQTRFLYVPLLLMILSVISDEKIMRKSLILCLLFSLFITTISVYRAHKADLFPVAENVLRPYDQELIKMSKMVDYSRPTEVPFVDSAFADFPITVRQKSAFVLTRPAK